MFSRRAEWQPALNRLSQARAERVRQGLEILDLTVSNPTAVGIDYPLDELAAALGAAAREPYDPQPLGIGSARAAVARSLGCEAADVVITASTSESYSYLFKLLAHPGDEIATAVPSYPLLEHLAALELLTLRTFPLEFHRRWELHGVGVTSSTRAIAVVSPNNPTGSFIRADEMGRLAALGVPLIIDEVFRDYALGSVGPASPPESVLTFSLGGLSKAAGLPHYKLGWIRVSGPPREKQLALDGLELIADTFLSVSTPVQVALPQLLQIGETIRARIRERLAANLDFLHSAVARQPSVEVLPVEGGWSVVLRVPAVSSDEDLALSLLSHGVAVQPGYFFEFAADGFLVLSLLTSPEVFRKGIGRLLEVVSR